MCLASSNCTIILLSASLALHAYQFFFFLFLAQTPNIHVCSITCWLLLSSLWLLCTRDNPSLGNNFLHCCSWNMWNTPSPASGHRCSVGLVGGIICSLPFNVISSTWTLLNYSLHLRCTSYAFFYSQNALRHSHSPCYSLLSSIYSLAYTIVFRCASCICQFHMKTQPISVVLISTL